MPQTGDLNQDGRLDANDVALLKGLLANDSQLCQHLSPAEIALLDVNHDGQIDQDDLTALYHKMLNASGHASAETSEKLAKLRHKLS